MKKIILFILVLLPFLGIGQTQLVRWNGSEGINYSTLPDIFVSTIFENNSNNLLRSGFSINATTNKLQYMEFLLDSNSGINIRLSTYNFILKKNPTCSTKFIVKYFLDKSTRKSIGGETTIALTDSAALIDFSTLNVASATAFLLRIYPYVATDSTDYDDYFCIQHANTTISNILTTRPKFSGTVDFKQTHQIPFGFKNWIGYV